MADPARPALPEVLAALTDTDADLWGACRSVAADGAVVGTLGNTNVPCVVRWTATDPTDAAELLVTRGVLPEGWHGDTRRGWACPGCGGRGCGPGFTGPERCVEGGPDYTIPDLVAVASLGWPAIQRAEELARAACHALREYGCPTPERVVWRVGDRGPVHREVYARDVGYPGGIMLCANGSCTAEAPAGNVCSIDARTARELWTSGLALDRITPDAVVVVVPPVGGVR